MAEVASQFKSCRLARLKTNEERSVTEADYDMLAPNLRVSESI
jgi:hypothetical protein